ncbi:hypothetical protein E4U41_004388 [Claviceps citrina]|nr:hypothetical protein E4U41_004388 [Claviceps citrina]
MSSSADLKRRDELWQAFLDRNGLQMLWSAIPETEQKRYRQIVEDLEAEDEVRRMSEKMIVEERRKWAVRSRLWAPRRRERCQGSLDALFKAADMVQLAWAKRVHQKAAFDRAHRACAEGTGRSRWIRLGDSLVDDDGARKKVVHATLHQSRYYFGNPGGRYIFRHATPEKHPNEASSGADMGGYWHDASWERLLQVNEDELPGSYKFCGIVPRTMKEHTARFAIICPKVMRLLGSLILFYNSISHGNGNGNGNGNEMDNDDKNDNADNHNHNDSNGHSNNHNHISSNGHNNNYHYRMGDEQMELLLATFPETATSVTPFQLVNLMRMWDQLPTDDDEEARGWMHEKARNHPLVLECASLLFTIGKVAQGFLWRLWPVAYTMYLATGWQASSLVNAYDAMLEQEAMIELLQKKNVEQCILISSEIQEDIHTFFQDRRFKVDPLHPLNRFKHIDVRPTLDELEKLLQLDDDDDDTVTDSELSHPLDSNVRLSESPDPESELYKYLSSPALPRASSTQLVDRWLSDFWDPEKTDVWNPPYPWSDAEDCGSETTETLGGDEIIEESDEAAEEQQEDTDSSDSSLNSERKPTHAAKRRRRFSSESYTSLQSPKEANPTKKPSRRSKAVKCR